MRRESGAVNISTLGLLASASSSAKNLPGVLFNVLSYKNNISAIYILTSYFLHQSYKVMISMG